VTGSSDFSRPAQLDRLTGSGAFDMLIVGGGATGVGLALDAASRGYRTALCEQHDFGKGTSSRSTKLVHGGVRYLKQGNVALVRDALRERGLLRDNAPHLVYPLPTIVPLFRWWEPFYYGAGLKAYDALAGSWNFVRSRRLSTKQTAARLPTINTAGLRGGIQYHDAAFDDTRLLINMAQTAVENGAVCVNYARVVDLVRQGGRIAGAVVLDTETGQSHTVAAKVVINAAGPFGDEVRRLDQPQLAGEIAASQGAHVVLPARFLPGKSALIVPKTPDGRVIFAIPWQGRVLLGTTDTPLHAASLEPRPLEEEIGFLLETIRPYLTDPPRCDDICSTFAGIRPLVKAGGAKDTSKLARDHVVRVSDAHLVSVLGGKWTTWRKMAEDGIDRAAAVAGLPRRRCKTKTLSIKAPARHDSALPFAEYGADAAALAALAGAASEMNRQLAPGLPYVAAQVVWAARHEMARSVEDVLARRLRALFLDAPAALAMAPAVAEIMARELGHVGSWREQQLADFKEVARGYCV